MRSVIALWLALAVICLAGCPPQQRTMQPAQRAGGDGTCEDIAWSCVGVLPNGGAAWGCTEGNASQRDQYQATCTADKNGIFALTGCPRDNAIGGCTVVRGSQCTTTWFNVPATRASVEGDCAKQGAMFVAGPGAPVLQQ